MRVLALPLGGNAVTDLFDLFAADQCYSAVAEVPNQHSLFQAAK
jgi:hypothetical protein